jgi:hypothetical protein
MIQCHSLPLRGPPNIHCSAQGRGYRSIDFFHKRSARNGRARRPPLRSLCKASASIASMPPRMKLMLTCMLDRRACGTWSSALSSGENNHRVGTARGEDSASSSQPHWNREVEGEKEIRYCFQDERCFRLTWLDDHRSIVSDDRERQGEVGGLVWLLG